MILQLTLTELDFTDYIGQLRNPTRAVYVRVHAIEAFRPFEGGTQIDLASGVCIIVDEPPGTILQAIYR